MSTFKLLLHRQPGLLPGRDAAGKVGDAREALLLQRRERLRRTLAAVAADDQRTLLAFAEVGAGSVEPRKRQVLRAEHMTCGELVRLAHVDDERVLTIDQLRRLRRAEPRTTRRAAHERPEQHPAGDEGDGKEEEVIADEFHEARHYN